ncbi:MAG TPA: PilN domain-containing protein [Burkholderiales bacterium]|nr:PilN domain-containing protein [Burkholderiales bacterium]
MQRLQLDFLRPGGAPWPIGPLLLVFGLLAATLTGWKFAALSAEQVRLQAQIGDTQRLLRREMPRVYTDSKQLADQVARANLVLAALTVPWDAMFTELERVADQNVALLAIQPEGSGKHVQLSGEARHFEDVMAYVKRLEQSVGFSNVFLSRHEAQEEGGISFTLGADWTGQ